MGERLFDDIARVLATPMPRRRALRLIGSSLLAGTGMAALRSARAGAAQTAGCPPPYVGCGNIKLPHNPLVLPFCDGPGTTCCQGTSVDGPRAWTIPKGRYFCSPGYSCSPANGGGCVKAKCPPGTIRCGTKCCKEGLSCCHARDGRTTCCAKGSECCKVAPKCCPPGKFCFWTIPYKQGEPIVCCRRKDEAGCAVGAPGRQKATCCREPSKCFRMILPGQGAITPDSPWVCCPEERVVPNQACCPPGTVSMGGALVIPSGGGGGLCCPQGSACGSGKNITCCGYAPGFEQVCRDGQCVSP
jgi:hypothetical protein